MSILGSNKGGEGILYRNHKTLLVKAGLAGSYRVEVGQEVGPLNVVQAEVAFDLNGWGWLAKK